MPEVSRYEPRLALDGGPSGLELTLRILRGAHARLAADGALLVETGAELMPQLLDAARAAGFRHVEALRDLAGTERALWAQKEEACGGC